MKTRPKSNRKDAAIHGSAEFWKMVEFHGVSVPHMFHLSARSGSIPFSPDLPGKEVQSRDPVREPCDRDGFSQFRENQARCHRKQLQILRPNAWKSVRTGRERQVKYLLAFRLCSCLRAHSAAQKSTAAPRGHTGETPGETPMLPWTGCRAGR